MEFRVLQVKNSMRNFNYFSCSLFPLFFFHLPHFIQIIWISWNIAGVKASSLLSLHNFPFAWICLVLLIFFYFCYTLKMFWYTGVVGVEGGGGARSYLPQIHFHLLIFLNSFPVAGCPRLTTWSGSSWHLWLSLKLWVCDKLIPHQYCQALARTKCLRSLKLHSIFLRYPP